MKEIFKWALLLGTAISGVVAIFAFTFPRLILSVFIHHEPVLAIGVEYLRIVAPCYFLFALMFVSAGVVNGAGQTVIPMMLTLISLWLVRVPLAWFLSQRTPLGIKGIWIAMAAGFAVTGRSRLSVLRVRPLEKGRRQRSRRPDGQTRRNDHRSLRKPQTPGQSD